MAVVDFIDLDDDDDEIIEVDYVDTARSEIAAKAAASSSTTKGSTAVTISLSVIKQEQGATTSGAAVSEEDATFASSFIVEKVAQPENQELLVGGAVAEEALHSGNKERIAAHECAEEAMQSEHAGKGAISLPMSQEGANKAKDAMQSENQELLAAGDVGKEAIQSRNQELVATGGFSEEHTRSGNTAEALVSSSMTGHGATCRNLRVEQLCQMIGCPHIVLDGFSSCVSHGGGPLHDEPGSITVGCAKLEVSTKCKGHSEFRVTGTCNNDGHEESNGNAETDEYTDLQKGTKALDIDDDDVVMVQLPSSPVATQVGEMPSYPVARKDVVVMSSAPQDKEKKINRFGTLYSIKVKKQVKTSAAECSKRFSIVHTEGMQPTVYSENSKLRVMADTGNATGSKGMENYDAQEELEGDTETDDDNNFQIGSEALSPVDVDDDGETVMCNHQGRSKRVTPRYLTPVRL